MSGTYEELFESDQWMEEAEKDLGLQSALARDLGDRLQSRNVPLGTSGDFLMECFKAVN